MTLQDTDSAENPVVADLPLWKSFWVGQGGALLLGVLISFAIPWLVVYRLGMDLGTATIIGWGLFLPFYTMLMVSLWKCAYNTKTRFLGHLARIYAVASLLFLVAIAWSIITEPEAGAAANATAAATSK